jgi:hypothetical protein
MHLKCTKPGVCWFFCGSQPMAPVMRASREAAAGLAGETAILCRRGALAFSHGHDPKPTSLVRRGDYTRLARFCPSTQPNSRSPVRSASTYGGGAPARPTPSHAMRRIRLA